MLADDAGHTIIRRPNGLVSVLPALGATFGWSSSCSVHHNGRPDCCGGFAFQERASLANRNKGPPDQVFSRDKARLVRRSRQ